MPNSPWSGTSSFQELSAPFLLAKQAAPRRLTLQFTAPTTFKSGGRHIPIPLPGLVFGSLLDKWNAFAPVTFPPEARRFAEECLAVSKYRLSSRRVPVKSGGLRMGAVGEITYTSINYDRYWMSVMAVLAAYAIYSGVGAGATMGLGQCREIALPFKKPASQDITLE
jgi:CRISPR-associated endoribonuclease Cas6